MGEEPSIYIKLFGNKVRPRPAVHSWADLNVLCKNFKKLKNNHFWLNCNFVVVKFIEPLFFVVSSYFWTNKFKFLKLHDYNTNLEHKNNKSGHICSIILSSRAYEKYGTLNTNVVVYLPNFFKFITVCLVWYCIVLSFSARQSKLLNWSLCQRLESKQCFYKCT